MSTERPLIAILNANSKQSKAVVDHLVSLGDAFSQHYRLRAIVRNPDNYANPNTKIVESVMKGDMTDINSLYDSLVDVSILFFLTVSDAEKGADYERECGSNVVEAFLKEIRGKRRNGGGKPLLVFSSFPHVSRETGGKIFMGNAEGKALVEKKIRELQGEKEDFDCSFIYPGMFMQNFTNYSKPQESEGVFTFVGPYRPDMLIPFVDIRDMGPLFADIIHNQDQYNRKTTRLVGDWLTYSQVASTFQQCTGKKSIAVSMEVDEFVKFMGGRESPMGRMMGDMYDWMNQYGYFGLEQPGSKIIAEQPSRKTRWSQFVREFFTEQKSEKGVHPKNDAEKALFDWMDYFMPKNSNVAFEDFMMKRFVQSAVVEFPYLPEKLKGTIPQRLEGHKEILGYFGNWRGIFKFDDCEFKRLATIEGSDGKQAVSEVRMRGQLLPSGKEYIQDYVNFVEVNEEGKIIRYTEYWAAERFQP